MHLIDKGQRLNPLILFPLTLAMSLLSKSEIQYLQGQKQVSKSYEYKLKSIIRKKITHLLDKEVPLLSTLFPKLNLTGFGKEEGPFESQIPGSNPGRSIASFPTYQSFGNLRHNNNTKFQDSEGNSKKPTFSNCPPNHLSVVMPTKVVADTLLTRAATCRRQGI